MRKGMLAGMVCAFLAFSVPAMACYFWDVNLTTDCYGYKITALACGEEDSNNDILEFVFSINGGEPVKHEFIITGDSPSNYCLPVVMTGEWGEELCGDVEIDGQLNWWEYETGYWLDYRIFPTQKHYCPCCVGKIGDFVWNDINKNGLQDAGEPGIEGVVVKLYNEGGEVASTITDADGSYLFSELCPDYYVVEVIDPDGYIPTECDQGTDDAIDSDCSPLAVNLETVLEYLTIDFGFYKIECKGKIGDFVWNDINKNGLQDAGEPGIEGVVVKLLNEGGEVATTTTDADGFYLFNELCADFYQVVVVDPDGYLASPCDQGSDDAIDSDCSPVDVDLGTDEENLTIDFGFYSTPCEGKIGDFVWNDINKNGLQDAGEPGIEGVIVKLYNEGGEVASTITDADGFYLFGDLCDDSYEVVVIDPIGYSPTACGQGSDDTIDSNCSPVFVNLGETTEEDLTIDFGYYYNYICDLEVLKTASPDTITPVSPLDCDTLGKPTSLVFLYTGAGCSASNNGQGTKATCSGSINGSKSVSVKAGDKKLDSKKLYKVEPKIVNPGETFTISPNPKKKKLESDSRFQLHNSGGTQELRIHTSCSKPLKIGDVFGSLTLVGFNGQVSGTGNQVTYTYVIKNHGDALSEVEVMDDKLGMIADLFDLASGETITFTKEVEILATTTNTVTVTGILENLVVCGPAEASATVTVVETPQASSCDDGKPSKLGMRYLGGECVAGGNDQDPKKATCEGTGPVTGTVYIVATGKKADDVWFAGVVAVDDIFYIDGNGKLDSETHVYVYASQGGSLLQSIEFHTSCSQALAIGDRFGTLLLEEFFASEDGKKKKKKKKK